MIPVGCYVKREGESVNQSGLLLEALFGIIPVNASFLYCSFIKLEESAVEIRGLYKASLLFIFEKGGFDVYDCCIA